MNPGITRWKLDSLKPKPGSPVQSCLKFSQVLGHTRHTDVGDSTRQARIESTVEAEAHHDFSNILPVQGHVEEDLREPVLRVSHCDRRHLWLRTEGAGIHFRLIGSLVEPLVQVLLGRVLSATSCEPAASQNVGYLLPHLLLLSIPVAPLGIAPLLD